MKLGLKDSIPEQDQCVFLINLPSVFHGYGRLHLDFEMECSKLRYALDTYGAKSYVCHQFLKFKQYSTLTESCIQLSIGSI